MQVNSRQLKQFLTKQVVNQNKDAIMISGAPGCAKSTIVAQVAKENDLEFIDLRVSQIAPTDLRGIPAVDVDNNVFKYLPPNFLPKPNRPKGILFLDELTQAVPAVQAIAQQLVLDRKVGDYSIPSGWFIWAAGNRTGDRSASFGMIKSLGNRFLHLEMQPELQVWLQDFAIENLTAEISAFVKFRPELLHKVLDDSDAWPSPRSWEMADRLHKAGCSIAPAVGAATAAEFDAFITEYKHVPDLEAIFNGKGKTIEFPQFKGESIKYATTIGLLKLAIQSKGPEIVNSLLWLYEKGPMEYAAMYSAELSEMQHGRPDWTGYRYYLGQLNKNKQLIELNDRMYKSVYH